MGPFEWAVYCIDWVVALKTRLIKFKSHFNLVDWLKVVSILKKNEQLKPDAPEATRLAFTAVGFVFPIEFAWCLLWSMSIGVSKRPSINRL